MLCKIYQVNQSTAKAASSINIVITKLPKVMEPVVIIWATFEKKKKINTSKTKPKIIRNEYKGMDNIVCMNNVRNTKATKSTK